MFAHTSEQMVASWVVGADAGALVSARLEEAEPGTGGKCEHPQLAWHSGPPGALPGPGFKSHPFPLWVAHCSPTGVSAQPATLYYCLVPYLPHPARSPCPLPVCVFVLAISCGHPLERLVRALSIRPAGLHPRATHVPPTKHILTPECAFLLIRPELLREQGLPGPWLAGQVVGNGGLLRAGVGQDSDRDVAAAVSLGAAPAQVQADLQASRVADKPPSGTGPTGLKIIQSSETVPLALDWHDRMCTIQSLLPRSSQASPRPIIHIFASALHPALLFRKCNR